MFLPLNLYFSHRCKLSYAFLKRWRKMSRHAHTPSNTPAPAAIITNAKGATLPRTIDNTTAPSPYATNQSPATPKKYSARKLGFGSRRKSCIPITNKIPSTDPKNTNGISGHVMGGCAAAPASNALDPHNALKMAVPAISQCRVFIAI